MEEPQTVSDFLNQTEFWINRDGFIAIDEMTQLHRRRAAQTLLRRGRLIGVWQLDEDLPTESNQVREFFSRLGAPASFVKNTPLYQRLIMDGADPDTAWLDSDD